MAYRKDVDLSELIDQAVAKGDYKSAAQLEQERNEKIKGEGMDYATTNRFGGWLDKTDYGDIGLSQIASGASKDAVKQTYEQRLAKASNTEGMSQYTNDSIMQQMLDYINADPGKGTTSTGQPTFNYNNYQAENPKPVQEESSYSANIDQMLAEILSRDDFTYDAMAPTYADSYGSRIEEMLGQIQNRDPFSYDAASDPLYQQYEERYTREGNRAMNDTLASIASGAGGMNSYAVTAAQQANNNYMAQLADRIPELQQLAYEMYMQDYDNQLTELNLLRDMGQTEYNRYRDQYSDYMTNRNTAYQEYLDSIEREMAEMGLLQSMDETQYNRYRDTMNDWRNDRDFVYGSYRDDMGDYKWSEEFGYQKERDEVADNQWQQSFDHNVSQDLIGNQQWSDSFQHQKEQDAIGNQQWKDSFQHQQAQDAIGNSQWQQSHDASVSQWQQSQNQNASKEAYNKVIDKLSNGIMPTSKELMQAGFTEAQAQTWIANAQKGNGGNGYTGTGVGDGEATYWNMVNSLGLGSIDAATVTAMIDAGGIIVDADGNLSLAPGWTAQNYQSMLEKYAKPGGTPSRNVAY